MTKFNYKLYILCLISFALIISKASSSSIDNNIDRNDIKGDKYGRQSKPAKAKQLALPTGARLNLGTTLNIPFILAGAGPPPMQLNIGLPMTLNLDELGLTSSADPISSLIGSVSSLFGLAPLESFPSLPIPLGLRIKRDIKSHGPSQHGGDRKLMYSAVEKSLDQMGLEGRSCMLRSICEMQQVSLEDYGFMGEVLERFLSASKGEEADSRLSEYVEAENTGKHQQCSNYSRQCSKSLFKKFNEESE